MKQLKRTIWETIKLLKWH